MTRALLIHGGTLGDFVLSLRVVSALRASGAAHVSVLGRPAVCGIACPRGGVDEVRDIEAHGYHRLFSAESELGEAAREWLAGFDLAVNMLPDGDGVVSGHLKRAGVRAVIELDPRPRPGTRRHITDQWLAAVQTEGILGGGDAPEIHIEAALADRARAIFGERGTAGERTILLAPGSGSRKKCWPAAEYLSLAFLAHRAGWMPVCLLGPVERETFSDGERASIGQSMPILDGLTVIDLAACLTVARAYVGNDSGVSHVAAAVGARVVAIFGPTDPAVWRPLGRRVRVAGGGDGANWPSVQTVWQHVLEAIQC